MRPIRFELIYFDKGRDRNEQFSKGLFDSVLKAN